MPAGNGGWGPSRQSPHRPAIATELPGAPPRRRPPARPRRPPRPACPRSQAGCSRRPLRSPAAARRRCAKLSGTVIRPWRSGISSEALAKKTRLRSLTAWVVSGWESQRLGDAGEFVPREDVEAALLPLPLGDHDSPSQLVPVLGGQEQPAFVVQPRRMSAEEHTGTHLLPPSASIALHCTPLSPTVNARWAPIWLSPPLKGQLAGGGAKWGTRRGRPGGAGEASPARPSRP